MNRALFLLVVASLLIGCQKSKVESSIYSVLPSLDLSVDSATYIKDKNNEDIQILRVLGHWIGSSPSSNFKIEINFPEPFSQKPPKLRSWYLQGPADKVTDTYCPVTFEIKGPLPATPPKLLISLIPNDSQTPKKQIIIDVPRFETIYIDGVTRPKAEQDAAANP